MAAGWFTCAIHAGMADVIEEYKPPEQASEITCL